MRKGKGKEEEGQDWLGKAELSLKIWSPQSDLQALLGSLGIAVLLGLLAS